MQGIPTDTFSGNDRRRFQRRALLDRRRQERVEERRMSADRRAAVRDAEEFWNREPFDEPTLNKDN